MSPSSPIGGGEDRTMAQTKVKPKKIELYQQVALTRDLPEYGLKAGDVAVVVEHLPAPATPEGRGEEGYALEVFNAVGETLAVVMVPASAVRPLREEEILHVRAHTAG